MSNLQDLQREQEARNFLGRNGINYVEKLATEEEIKHFEGILYSKGSPNFAIISYLISPACSY